jgi:drug/metabolite transporter (DMT)-like permease
VSPGVSPRAAAVAGALAVVYVVWGSTYLGIAVAIETLPPLLMAAARFLLAGALLYALSTRFGDGEDDPVGRRQWLAALGTGGALFMVGNGGVVWGQQTVASGIAALLIATVALWIVVLDRVLFGRRLTRRELVGLLVGFGGLAVLVDPSGGVDPAGAAVLAVAAVGWATGSLLSRGAALPRRPLVAASLQMLAGGVLLAVAGVVTGELSEVDLGAASQRSVAAFAYLVLFGSLLAFSAYAWLLRATRTSLVATYAYVNPVVAVGLGWLFLDEEITARTLLAGGVIVAGVALIIGTPGPAESESASARPGGRVAHRRAGRIRPGEST